MHHLHHEMHDNHSGHHGVMHSGMEHTGHMIHHNVMDSGIDHSDHVMGAGNEMAGNTMGHMHMNDMNMHAMHITPITLTDFFFKGLRINSTSGLVVAMLFVMALTILFEGFNFWQHLKTKHQATTSNSNFDKFCRLSKETLGKILTVTLSYVIMLSVMTMNAWLLTSAVIGSGLGHLFMRPLLTWKMAEINARNVSTADKHRHNEMEELTAGNHDLPEVKFETENNEDLGAHERLLEPNF